MRLGDRVHLSSTGVIESTGTDINNDPVYCVRWDDTAGSSWHTAKELIADETAALRARVAELEVALVDLRGAAETLSVRVWDLGMIAAIERANRVIGTREVSASVCIAGEHSWQHRCGTCGAPSEIDGLVEHERTGAIEALRKISSLTKHDSPIHQVAQEALAWLVQEQRWASETGSGAKP